MKKLIPILLLITAVTSFGAGLVRYIDSAAPAGGNGQTIGTAWQNVTNVTGVGAGDIVYISGGTTSKTYTVSGAWTAPSGTSGSPFTLAINPAAGHNGKAIFRQSGGAPNQFLGNVNWVTLDGHLSTDAPNQNHFEVQGYWAIFFSPRASGTTNRGIVLRGFDTFDGAQAYMYQTDQSEVGWCYFGLFSNTGFSPKVVGIGKDGPQGYGRNSVHHCEMHQNYIHDVDLDHNNGNDFIKEPQSCDVYNNRFIAHLVAGTPRVGQDHQDGIQTANDDTLRIFNNYFENMANYMIYIENQSGNISNIQIWNNVFNYSDSALNLQPTQSVAIGSHDSGATMANVQVFNNTFRGGNQTITLGDNNGSIANTCHVVNNLSGPNAGGMALRGNNSGVISNNVSMTGTANYVDVNGGNFRLTASATAAINQGTSAFVSTITTADADGNPRVAPWDVGAYEFGTTGPDVTPPTISTATINGAGNQVTVVFSESVNFGAGGSGGFTLNMNGGTSVMSTPIGMNSNSIIFNLSRIIQAVETGTLSYTQPGNGWQDLATAPNALASFPPPTVNVSNGSTQGPPALNSATINSAGTQIALVFSQTVQAGSGGSGGWTLGVTPAATLGTMTGTGTNTLTYNINRVINQGEAITLSYAQPVNGIEAVSSGADVASITNRPVTNNSTQGATSTPVITLAAGPYFGTQTTTITDADTGSGAVIHYTVDGTTPTGSSPVYSAPISISTNQTIQAIATWTGHLNSAPTSSTYEVVSWTSLGTAWKTFTVGQKTGTFTWNFSVTAPAAGSDAVVGLGPSAVSAYTGMACIVQFNANTINAINGGGYTTGPAYTPSANYNFAATINLTAHTWSCTVTPAAGGATSTLVTNAAFRTEQAAATQLSWVGIQANSGTIQVSNMAFPSGPSSARYIGLRGVPAAGGAVP